MEAGAPLKAYTEKVSSPANPASTSPVPPWSLSFLLPPYRTSLPASPERSTGTVAWRQSMKSSPALPRTTTLLTDVALNDPIREDPPYTSTEIGTDLMNGFVDAVAVLTTAILSAESVPVTVSTPVVPRLAVAEKNWRPS